jgi:hypothetical protein
VAARGHRQGDSLDGARPAVANERADEHEAVDQVRSIGGHECCGSGGHGVPDYDRRPGEPFDQRRITRGVCVSLGGEGRVAVAMLPETGARHPTAAPRSEGCRWPQYRSVRQVLLTPDAKLVSISFRSSTSRTRGSGR